MRRGDGTYLLFEGRGRNLLHDPAVRGIVINSRDITAQHEAEELLRRSEERARNAEAWFRAMIDSGTDLLALIDADRNFTYISGAYERHLGYRPDEMLGTAALTHVHPDDLAVVGPPLQRVLQTPGAEETVTFRYRAKDGTYRWFEARGRNRVDDPVIRAVVVNSRDVTDRVQAEERLRQSEEARQEQRAVVPRDDRQRHRPADGDRRRGPVHLRQRRAGADARVPGRADARPQLHG